MPLPRGKLSGMQRDVLSLYRSFLREVRRRRQLEQQQQLPPAADASSSGSRQLAAFVGQEFRRCASLDKKEYQMIEHLLRKGAKQLQMLKDQSTTGFQITKGG